jgi:hypothetical protein
MKSHALIELLDNKKICFNTECDRQSVSSCTSSAKDQDERVRELEALLLEKESKNQQTEEHIRNMRVQEQIQNEKISREREQMTIEREEISREKEKISRERDDAIRNTTGSQVKSSY